MKIIKAIIIKEITLVSILVIDLNLFIKYEIGIKNKRAIIENPPYLKAG